MRAAVHVRHHRPAQGCILPNRYFLHAGGWYARIGGLAALRPGQERMLTPLPLVRERHGLFRHGHGADGRLPDPAGPLPPAQLVGQRARLARHGAALPGRDARHPDEGRALAQDAQPGIRFGFGAGVDRKLHSPFEARFGFPLLEAWAMTETGAGAVIIASKEPRHIGSSCFGAEEDDVQVRIVTDAGVEAATGEPGELLVRHAGDDPRYGFFAGYLKDAAATDEAWEGGWFHTGDIVRREADGALRFVDRKKNVIRRSGENISAVEVESVLMQHPLVKAVAVAAVPDAVRGDEVLACVVPADPLATDADRQEAARAIVQWSLEQLAYYKAPGYVAFVDSLPLTTTNKIQRGEMKALAPTLPGTAHCVDTCAMKRKTRENPRRSRAMSRLGYDGVVAALPVTIPYERYSTHAAHWWLGRALGALIRQAGLAKTDVDGLCVSSFTLAPDSAVGLVQHLGMSPRWLDHIPMGGASGVAALRRARRAGRRRRDRGLHRGRHQSRGLVPQHRQPVLALRPGRRVSLRRRRPERQLRAADRALYARVRRHPRDFGKLCVAQRDNALRYRTR